MAAEALNLLHKLVPRRKRRYRLNSADPSINRSMDSILDCLEGSKRRASYPHHSELRAIKRLKTLKMLSNCQTVYDTLEQIQMVQGMIDINASSLNSLRTQFATNSDLIQQEIRTLEGKLVKLFSRQLVAKQKCSDRGNHSDELRFYPKLEQWLQVVGINEDAIKDLEEKCSTVEGLLSMPDDKVKAILGTYADGEEESRRLISALKHLQAYTERQKQGHKDSTSDIYWDSWDTGKMREKSQPTTPSQRSSRSSVVLDNDVPLSSPGSDADTEGSRLSAGAASDSDNAFSPKPSPRPDHGRMSQGHLPRLKRSASDEVNLGNRIHLPVENASATVGKAQGKRLAPVIPLHIEIPKSTSGDISQSDSESDHTAGSQARSPVIRHYGVGHTINHRFSQKTFVVSLACDFCRKLLLVGVRCKECKFKCHKKCAKLVPPSCGLPKGCSDFFKDRLRRAYEYRSLPMIRPSNSEPSSIALQVEGMLRDRQAGIHTNRSHGDLYVHSIKRNWSVKDDTRKEAGTDSCSASSSTSSAPSSPSAGDNGISLSAQEELDDHFPVTSHFSFPPDVSKMTSSIKSDEMIDSTSTLVRTESVKSRQSNNTTNSNDSTLSGGDVPGIESLDMQISDVDPETRTWGRRVGKKHMLWDLHERGSLMSEWVIPFEELEITGNPLGSGRFGKVYRGHWHGEVAVKMIEIENPTEQQLNAFKFQVMTFRKTRHENVVLFMGACMDPPKLAIITSMCRGQSLYTHVHVRKDNFPPERIAHICTQVAQGMGYLHARGIVHTDLRSKNVFLEMNNRVVITDFGLFSVAGLTAKSARPGSLMIPRGWLPYLAPEILRSLTTQQDAPESSKFTKATDMYAFGTIWFEMCSGMWPFKGEIPESIIWKVGKGLKQSLDHIDMDIPQEVRDTLTVCWAFEPERRPSFSDLLRTLERLPRQKQRLHRSPSQPCTVGRGGDGLFKR